MTRKDFHELAAILVTVPDRAERERLADLFAALCQAGNPRFDTARFLTACGIEAEQ